MDRLSSSPKATFILCITGKAKYNRYLYTLVKFDENVFVIIIIINYCGVLKKKNLKKQTIRKFVRVNQNFNIFKNIHTLRNFGQQKTVQTLYRRLKTQLYNRYIYILPTNDAAGTRYQNKNHTPYTNTTLLTACDTRHHDSNIFAPIMQYNICLSLCTHRPTHTNTPTHRHIYYNRLFRNRIENLDFYVTWSIVKDPAAATAASAAGPRETTLLHTVLLSS